MQAPPGLPKEFNPLLPGLTEKQLLVMFIKAAATGRMETFQLMPLEKQQKFINLRDPDEPHAARTALIEAGMAGHAHIVSHLLTLKPDLEIMDHQGWTALAGAAWRGSDETVTLLLDANAKIDARDTENWTPLHDAISSEKPSTVLLLLSRGADPRIQADGMNALEKAQDMNMHEVIPALEKAMAKYNTEAVVKVMGHTTRAIPAPSPATFRRKHAPG